MSYKIVLLAACNVFNSTSTYRNKNTVVTIQSVLVEGPSLGIMLFSGHKFKCNNYLYTNTLQLNSWAWRRCATNNTLRVFLSVAIQLVILLHTVHVNQAAKCLHLM